MQKLLNNAFFVDTCAVTLCIYEIRDTFVVECHIMSSFLSIPHAIWQQAKLNKPNKHSLNLSKNQPQQTNTVIFIVCTFHSTCKILPKYKKKKYLKNHFQIKTIYSKTKQTAKLFILHIFLAAG